MNEHDSFTDPVYEEQMHLAERELSSFMAAVTKLYGQSRPDLRQRIGSTNQNSWTVRLDLKPEIGVRSRSRRRLD